MLTDVRILGVVYTAGSKSQRLRERAKEGLILVVPSMSTSLRALRAIHKRHRVAVYRRPKSITIVNGAEVSSIERLEARFRDY